MLKSIRFTTDHYTFQEGQTIHFRPDFNGLVGDQGTGKSTLLRAIVESENIAKVDGSGNFKFLDLESDNPRKAHYFKGPFDIHSKFISHGESNNLLLSPLEKEKDTLFLLDEPDSALSPRSCYKLIKSFRKAFKNGCQIVCAIHNPIIIQAHYEVFNLEIMDWVTSHEFLESQKKPMRKRGKNHE